MEGFLSQEASQKEEPLRKITHGTCEGEERGR
jgi:hypothetical protein